MSFTIVNTNAPLQDPIVQSKIKVDSITLPATCTVGVDVVGNIECKFVNMIDTIHMHITGNIELNNPSDPLVVSVGEQYSQFLPATSWVKSIPLTSDQDGDLIGVIQSNASVPNSFTVFKSVGMNSFSFETIGFNSILTFHK